MARRWPGIIRPDWSGFQRISARKGIDAGIHYLLPVHRQAAYLKQGYGEISLPVTEQVAAEIISLPMYPELTREQIEFVVILSKRHCESMA